MLPYWLLFAYFAAGALLERSDRGAGQAKGGLFFAFGAIIVVLMIGFRYEVGGDWGSYVLMYKYAGLFSLNRMLLIGDPGYMALNWLIQSLGLELWAVNLVCAAVFTWGLVRLTRVQPAPWLAMLVAVPYLIIVVAMGYSRQGMAIGILMAGLASLQKGGSTLRFALYVALAVLFHKTAVFALPLATFASRRNKLLNLFIAVASFWLLFNFFLKDSVDAFIENYIQRQYSSQGALIRLVISVVPALIFLGIPTKFNFNKEQRVIWRNMAFTALGLLVALALTPSSTAIDRLALYVLPLQLVIFSRLPGLFRSEGLTRVAVVLYSGAMQFVWLNFAVHSEAWVPYRTYLLQG